MTSDSSFAGKFLRKLKKIDTDQIEQFVGQMLREKELLEEVFEALSDGVIVADRSGRVMLANEAARQFLGQGRSECVGKQLDKLFRPEPLRDLLIEFEERLEPIRQREVNLRRGNSRRTVLLSVVPLENEEHLTTHSLWTISDRTEQHRLAEEKRHMGNIESLAALTAGVAHEVKNPLNSLNIHAQLISKAAAELEDRASADRSLERMRHSTGVILEEIQRLAKIVDDFTRAVRPVRLSIRREELPRVLQPLAELIGPECAQRGIELVLDFDPDVPPVLLDVEQIQQAVLNILKNAMEAVDKPEGLIQLRTRLKPDHVLIEVEDNGCGIPEQDRLKIFEPYHTTKFSGTGLGLMVVYRIVRAHRGALGLTSEVGRGTVFSIALPLDERPVRLLEAQVEPEMIEG